MMMDGRNVRAKKAALLPPQHAGKSNARLRLEWHCYLTLHRIYMQGNDDIVIGLGAGGLPHTLAPSPYDRVALDCETECEWVNGYLCQGEVKPLPAPNADLRVLQRAATVRTNWIMAHFWISPSHHDIASFDKAVALVERAAQTLSKNA